EMSQQCARVSEAPKTRFHRRPPPWGPVFVPDPDLALSQGRSSSAELKPQPIAGREAGGERLAKTHPVAIRTGQRQTGIGALDLIEQIQPSAVAEHVLGDGSGPDHDVLKGRLAE